MPFDSLLARGSTALLVVDIQRGGAEPAGVSGIGLMDGFHDVVASAERIVGAAGDAGVPVIFFPEVRRRVVEDCVLGSTPARPAGSLDAMPSTILTASP